MTDSSLAADDGGSGDEDNEHIGSVVTNSSLGMDSKPYNRFEFRLRVNYVQWKVRADRGERRCWGDLREFCTRES